MDNLPTGSGNNDTQSRTNATGQPLNTKTTGKAAGKKRALFVLVGVIIAAAVIGLALWNIYRTSTAAVIDASKYQAVFLTNGQVYFGKLTRLNSSYLKMTDIFYIQSTTADKTDSENPQEAAANKPTDVQLIKLGSEVHGPEDEMIIEKSQVLFFENLKKDGKVGTSIDKYKDDQKK